MTNEPTSFNFNDENLAKAQVIIKKYPEGKQKSAILPLLDLAQRQMQGLVTKSRYRVRGKIP